MCLKHEMRLQAHGQWLIYKDSPNSDHSYGLNRLFLFNKYVKIGNAPRKKTIGANGEGDRRRIKGEKG